MFGAKSLCKALHNLLGDAYAIHSGGDNSTGIACAFANGVQVFEVGLHCFVTQNFDGGGGATFDTCQHTACAKALDFFVEV